MRILLNSVACLLSALLVYVSFSLFSDINRLQASLRLINQELESNNNSETKKSSALSALKSNSFSFLVWDSEINHTLAIAESNLVAGQGNKGQQQQTLGLVERFYDRALEFTPRHLSAQIGKLSLLIDQGAPLGYFLPRIEQLISFSPKDQDIKADIAMLCFKLSSGNQDQYSQTKLIDLMNKLFEYSMDYRGMLQVQRYARLFGQDDFLKKVTTNVKN